MAVDMFLKIDGIDGESSDHAHEGEIDLLAWSWGISQSGTMHIAKGGGAGKANISDIMVTKYTDSATANLMLACCNGKQFATAVLVCRKAGGDEQVEYFKIEMEDVIITSVSVGGSGGEDRQTETVSLNFALFNVTYTPQDNDGTALPEIGPVGWNIQKSEAV